MFSSLTDLDVLTMVDFEETKFAKQAKHKKRIREMKVKIKSLPDSSDFEFEVDATSTVRICNFRSFPGAFNFAIGTSTKTKH